MLYHHVRLWPKEPPRSAAEVSLDLTFEDLESRFLEPYRKGSSITIDGKTIPIDNLERINITRSEGNAEQIRQILIRELREKGVSESRIKWSISRETIARNAEDVTDEYISGPPGRVFASDAPSPTTLQPPKDAREVFVVHGRNLIARDALFDFLRTIDLHPLEWSEAIQKTGRASPYIGEILDAAFSTAHAVVVLLTPDDEAQLRDHFKQEGDPPHETQLTGQARPNVLFEAGMAIGRNDERTILLEMGHLRPFSDIAGRHSIRFSDSSQSRQELAKRLESAGCPVKLDGTDWHTAGDFNAAFEKVVRNSHQPTLIEEQSSIAEPLQLTEEAKSLLVKATRNNSRQIMKLRVMAGTIIRAGNSTLNEVGDSRSEAKWEQALEDLIEQELARDPYGEGEIYEITQKGFDRADELERQCQLEDASS